MNDIAAEKSDLWRRENPHWGGKNDDVKNSTHGTFLESGLEVLRTYFQRLWVAHFNFCQYLQDLRQLKVPLKTKLKCLELEAWEEWAIPGLLSGSLWEQDFFFQLLLLQNLVVPVPGQDWHHLPTSAAAQCLLQGLLVSPIKARRNPEPLPLSSLPTCWTFYGRIQQ